MKHIKNILDRAEELQAECHTFIKDMRAFGKNEGKYMGMMTHQDGANMWFYMKLAEQEERINLLSSTVKNLN